MTPNTGTKPFQGTSLKERIAINKELVKSVKLRPRKPEHMQNQREKASTIGSNMKLPAAESKEKLQMQLQELFKAKLAARKGATQNASPSQHSKSKKDARAAPSSTRNSKAQSSGATGRGEKPNPVANALMKTLALGLVKSAKKMDI